MQVLIARTLNKILLLFGAVIIILFAGIFAARRYFSEYARWYLLAFVIISIALAVIFRYLEENWDKNIITKMAKAGKIALANIRGGKRLMKIRDTFFRAYWIYELEGDLYNGDHEKLARTFQEKMNIEMNDIPRGSVYVTYDEQKPRQIFIIPNALIGNLPNLVPLVRAYENDKNLPVKYLDAHYNRGMVLRTFRAAVETYRKSRTGNTEK
ncbi:MAG: hypothetical protein LBN92_07600 [Treponema sp.]|jgi:membrane protein implicated in regulation of membrane protease activity|nr:hypothetical protein [Treponema sp.]